MLQHNLDIFILLVELDKLDKVTHAWIKMYLQSYTNTEI